LIVLVIAATSVVILRFERSGMDDFVVDAIPVPFSTLSGQTTGSSPAVAAVV